MKIHFQPFLLQYIPLWQRWIEKPYVKEIWFSEGYESSGYIYQKIAGNGYDYPFIIVVNDMPIGYMVCCDLYAYRMKCPKPKGLFINEAHGAFCMDLFIGEEDYLDKGYGTEIVKAFVDFIFEHFDALTLFIDPAVTNKRAIRCYEKAGFKFVREAFDGITQCAIMQIKKT